MGNVENWDNVQFVDGDEDAVGHADAAVGDDDPVEEGVGVGGLHEDEEDEWDVGGQHERHGRAPGHSGRGVQHCACLQLELLSGDGEGETVGAADGQIHGSKS